MNEFRCTNCKRLLAKIDGGKVQIKCHYCRTMNEFALHGPFDFTPRPREGFEEFAHRIKVEPLKATD